MKIKRTSQLTSKEHTLDLDVTLDQISRINNGELVQDVLPHLPSYEREFLISGITKEEWDTLLKSKKS